MSISGVYGDAGDPMPMMQMFDKGLQLRMGQCHVKRWVDEVLPLVLDDADPLGTMDMASHYRPVAQAPDSYALFQSKAGGCTKVILQPGRDQAEIRPSGAGAGEAS